MVFAISSQVTSALPNPGDAFGGASDEPSRVAVNIVVVANAAGANATSPASKAPNMDFRSMWASQMLKTDSDGGLMIHVHNYTLQQSSIVQ
jgi:hypothetical protein